VWLPNNVPSATTSRNHSTIALTVATKPNDTKIPPLANPLKYIAAEIVKVNKAKEVSKGQGDGVTKWNGCPWNCDRDNCIFIIYKESDTNEDYINAIYSIDD